MGQLLKMVRADYLIDAVGCNKIQGRPFKVSEVDVPHSARPGGLKQMATALTRKDFVSDQEVRWCPGCGDYAILAQVQKVMPEFGIPRENIGLHLGNRLFEPFSLLYEHLWLPYDSWPRARDRDRAKITRPDLDVWVVTGDGDGFRSAATT